MLNIRLAELDRTRSVPDYVAAVMKEYLEARLERLSISPGHASKNNPIVISVVRDEHERLPEFLRHYRQGGVEKFVFIDNGSTDGTPEFLATQPDVDLYRCTRPFNWMRKHGWISLAVTMYGRSRWYIYADGDEHIVFDGFDRGRSFADVAHLMMQHGIRRARGFLVDMYSDGPLLGSRYVRGDRLIDAYPYFDGTGYKEEAYKEIISRKGGPRQRAFSLADQNFRPALTKYPLFRLEGRDVFANPHHIWPYDENFVSECYFGILHFKFLPDVLARINRAVKEKNYWDGSMEYRCYATVLEQHPSLSLHCEHSVRYQGAESLKDLGLIAPLDWLQLE